MYNILCCAKSPFDISMLLSKDSNHMNCTRNFFIICTHETKSAENFEYHTKEGEPFILLYVLTSHENIPHPTHFLAKMELVILVHDLFVIELFFPVCTFRIQLSLVLVLDFYGITLIHIIRLNLFAIEYTFHFNKNINLTFSQNYRNPKDFQP